MQVSITWYTDPVEILRDLAQLLEYYNLRRSHPRYCLTGTRRAQALHEAFGILDLPPLVTAEYIIDGEEVAPVAQRRMGPGVGELLSLNMNTLR